MSHRSGYDNVRYEEIEDEADRLNYFRDNNDEHKAKVTTDRDNTYSTDDDSIGSARTFVRSLSSSLDLDEEEDDTLAVVDHPPNGRKDVESAMDNNSVSSTVDDDDEDAEKRGASLEDLVRQLAKDDDKTEDDQGEEDDDPCCLCPCCCCWIMRCERKTRRTVNPK